MENVRERERGAREGWPRRELWTHMKMTTRENSTCGVRAERPELTQVTAEDEDPAVAIHAAAQKPRDPEVPGDTPKPPGHSRRILPHPQLI